MAKIERWYQAAYRLQTAGDLDAAEPLYRRVLEKQPRHAEALYLLGSLYAQQGRCAEALPLLDRALAVRPHFTEALNNRAVALKELGRLPEALAAYDAVLALRPGYAEAHNNRGITLQALGRWEEAAESYRQAHAANPSYIEPLNNLGIVLKDKNLLAESEAAFRQALAVNPTATDPLNNLGLTLMAQARFEEAIACHDAALALRPDFPQALNSRGASLVALGRFGEARDGYTRALLLKPDYPDVRCNIALSYLSENRLEEALAAFDDVLRQDPELLSARWNRSLTLLVGGDFARGWAEYECRFRHKRVSAHASQKPLWDGAPLAGRTILIHAEQGLGDTLHFVRFLPLVRAGGGRVLFECPPALHPLIAGCDGIDTLLAPPARGEDHAEPYDLQVPLLSLPGLFGTVAETIPGPCPYVTAPADRSAAWKARIGEICASLGAAGAGLKVGLVWGGNPGHTNDHNRSCALAEFAPLAAIPGVTFWSLQKGPAAAQAADPPRGMTLVDLGPALADLADTAAAIAQMDLVISVDTSVVHLAGALGTPVWTLLPFCPDWRWQLDRDDSPWYPTMRLFRQSRPREWAAVLQRVGEELGRLTAHGIPGEEQAAHLVRLGETCFASGDFAEAGRCFEQALTAAPTHARARNNLAVLAFHEGRHDDALRVLEALLAQAPEHFSALENVARCWEAKGDDAQASHWWRRAVQASPHSPALWNSLAQCGIRRKDWADARNAFEHSFGLDASQTGVREILAEIDAVLGRGATPGGDSTPLVSVIIPCYKQAHLLPEAVGSVVAQTYTHWEMVIVNDGSPDDTQAVAQALIDAHPQHSIRLITKENGGLSAARNTGLAAATGAFFLPLDSDDRLHPQMLEKTIRALQEHPECSIAFTHTQHFGLAHNVWQNGPFALAQQCADNNIPYCSLMRREMVEALGGYAADVHAYEDWDFWLRALTQGHQAVLVPEPLFCYRQSAHSKLQQDNHRREFFVAHLVRRHPGIYPAERVARAEETVRAVTAERERFAATLSGPAGRDGRPRVLIVVDQFHPSVGGSERLAEEVGASLQQAGWEVEVATSPHPERCGDTHRGIRIHSCSGDIGERLRQIVSARHCDALIVLTNTNSAFLAAAGRLPAPRPRLILVPCINAFDFQWAQQSPHKKAALGDLLAQADAVVCSSRGGYDARLLSELGIASTYVPNAVRRVTPSAGGFRHRHGLAGDKPLLLVIGNHWPEKNHAGLLHALRDEPGEWQVVIIGHPAPQHPHVVTHTRQIAALDPRVTLIPGATPETVAAAMAEADLLLLPSIAEASPLVLLEAMSHRLPWLATPTCGSAPDHAGGLVLPLERFAPAIRFLLGDADARRALGDAGHGQWRAVYSWDVIGPRYAVLASATEALPPLDGPAEALQATEAVSAHFARSHPAEKPGEKPAISVVISTFNRVGLLRKVLQSYETQTLPRWAYEVVVVDDGSSDGTARFLKNYRPGYRLSVHRQPQNRGLSAARNQGILRAGGEIIVFQDDDDLATPDYLEQHLRSHQANPAQNIGVFGRIEASAAVANSVNFRIMNGAPGLYNYFDDIEDGQELDFRHFWMNVVSVKASLLKQFGFFDEETRWGLDDAELGWRLHAHGLRLIANRSARLLALRSISLTQFCNRQSKIGGAAAWMSRRHSDPQIPFWLNIANAEQRLPRLKEAWEQARGVVASLDIMEKSGWSAISQQPGFRETTFPALADLCRIGGEYHYLTGYLERLAGLEAQDRLVPPPGPGGPRVSIVVTSYNYGRYLAEAVGSVVAQTYTHWEMVIVNDGSPDDTQAVAQALIDAHPQHSIRLINQPNSGHAAHARNRGLAEASGAYLLCLDADDVLEPTFLAESVALLEANPRLSIAYTDQERFYADGTVERFYAGDYAQGHLTQYLPFGACSLFRRSAWAEAGPYKPVGYEDWDFWLSCAERGHIGRRIPKPLFRYRKHGEGKYAQDVNRGLTHKAWLVHNHPRMFDADARRWARGIVIADRWLAQPRRPLPSAGVSVLMTAGSADASSLHRSLVSLHEQTYANWELILLATERQDVAPALRALAAGARVTVLRAPESAGAADCLNHGLRAAGGRYVAYLPGGAAWEAGHLQDLVGFLESTGERAAYADAVGAPAPHFDYGRVFVANTIPWAGMVHEKACLDQTGPFDPALPAHVDWDLWIRLSRFFDIAHLPLETSMGATPPAPPPATELRALETIYARYAAATEADTLLTAAQQAITGQLRGRAEEADAREGALAEAEARFAGGDVAGAQELLNELLDRDPTNTRARNDLGVILWQGGEAQRALEHFRQALQAAPDDRATVLNCAEALQSLGLSEDAGLLLDGFLRRHPDDAVAARMWQEYPRPACRELAAA